MIINGKLYWAKVVGAPKGGYDKSVLEWSCDLSVNAETVKKLEAEGLKAKIKNKGDDRGDFISFKRKAVKFDGTPSKPIRVVDKAQKAWDSAVLIGNGTVANVSLLVNDTEYAGKKYKKPGIIAIQIVDLVPYEGGDHEEFPTYDEDGGEDWSGDAANG